MHLLSLNEASSGSLPASRFPEPASTYLCDQCGEDITERFSVSRAHGRPPLGPATFSCKCGQRYLSGTREWDQLSTNEKRTYLGVLRLTALFGLPFVVSLIAVALGVHQHSWTRTTVAAILAVLTAPFSIALAPALLEVRDIAASLLRTRILTRLRKKSPEGPPNPAR
jgi:hypothetical protein